MRHNTRKVRQRFLADFFTANRTSTTRLRRIAAALLMLVTLAVFWQVHSFEFVQWDDGLHIFENPYLQSVTFDNILAFWRKPYAELYIPLTYTLWALTATVSQGGRRLPPVASHSIPRCFTC